MAVEVLALHTYNYVSNNNAFNDGIKRASAFFLRKLIF